MNPNSMTGEPNQQNQTSVFGYDLYPPPYTVNWNQPKPFSPPATQLNSGIIPQQPQICTEHTAISQMFSGHLSSVQNPSSQFTLSPLPEPSIGFSFGTPRPTQDIVQFPFQVTNYGFGRKSFQLQPTRCKRKTDSPPLQPVKQHITEEKMAEHMSKLHINSETITTSKESESDRTQRLYMCEEMRKLQTDSILPQSLLARMQRPCTALVLWKPPTRLIPLPVANNDDENENNNAEALPDNNVMDNESEMENINEVIANNMDMDNS